ncbi:Tetraspanin-6 [Fragariocoptes setiger]|uniref:Tetraspanin n=1 Tax=Fragariocoptes setiger TaxID=1670756 RepID=A0ABQ7SA75_9ACAR|nr:Tetraspanin-6 [Fragariocoptes setiger]
MSRLCYTFSRYYVITINLIVTAVALFLVYVSLSAFDKDFGLDSLEDTHPRVVHTYISIIGAGTGVVIALLSLMGFFGAVKRSRVALTLYSAIIIIVVSFIIISLILTYRLASQKPPATKPDRDSINKTVSSYDYANSDDVATRAWDTIQTNLQCCGLTGPDDWTTYGKNGMIPRSCCKTRTESSLPKFEYCSSSDYKVGCWETATDFLYSHLSDVRIMLYVVLIFSLSCVVSALWVVRTLKKSVEVV